jgi:hypothetical protein
MSSGVSEEATTVVARSVCVAQSGGIESGIGTGTQS